MDPADALHPYASPLLADDLAGLPPATILTAEYDLTRGGAQAYARRLTAAGVPVDYQMAAGQIHASAMMTKALDAARTWRSQIIDALRAAPPAMTTTP